MSPQLTKIKETLAKMTLEEKIKLLTYNSLLDTKGFEEYGIPAIEMADGPCGIHSLHGKADKIEGGGVVMLPSPAVVSWSWNKDLARREGEYKIMVGASSVDIRLEASLNL